MNYQELVNKLSELTAEQLVMTVTVKASIEDEYFAVHSIDTNNDTGVLDKDHPFLVFNF